MALLALMQMNPGMMQMHQQVHGGWWGLGWLFQIVILLLFLAILWWLLKSQGAWGKDARAPLEILQARLAKGEISKKQYRELRAELEDEKGEGAA